MRKQKSSYIRLGDNMKQKVWEMLGAVFLICFSFYYTDKAVDIMRRNDPIMKEIEQVAKEKKVEAEDAVLQEQYLIPGYNGQKINEIESFQKMKQYGEYKESLLVFEETTPTISVEEYYDRFILSGNSVKNSVSFVFKVGKDVSAIAEIEKILNAKNVRATFFLDGLVLEQNPDLVYQLARDEMELEILNYDSSYDELMFHDSLTKLKSITNLKGKYCYAEYDQKEILELCGKQKMHTIIPTILVSNQPFSTVKNKMTSGSIIAFSNFDSTLKKELPVIIDYINQRGYKMTTLDFLLSESHSVEEK